METASSATARTFYPLRHFRASTLLANSGLQQTPPSRSLGRRS